MSKKYFIFPFCAFLLFVLFIISFVPSLAGKYRIKTFKTSLMNLKNKDSISEIKIINNKTGIHILKKSNFWIGNPSGLDKIIFPVEKEKINALLDSVCKIRSVYKISEKNIDFSDFNLNKELCTEFAYTLEDGRIFSIFIGKDDFSRSMTFFCKDDSEFVFKTENSFMQFLTSDVNYWCDPYFIAQNIFPEEKINPEKITNIFFTKDNIQKIYAAEKDIFSEKINQLCKLRHGRIFLGNTEDFKIILKMNIEFKNRRIFTMNFLKKSKHKEEFLIEYKDDLWNYCTSISGWTYKNLVNLFFD